MNDQPEGLDAVAGAALVYVALAVGLVVTELLLTVVGASGGMAGNIVGEPESVFLFAAFAAPGSAVAASLSDGSRVRVAIGGAVGAWTGLLGSVLLLSLYDNLRALFDDRLAVTILDPIVGASAVGVGTATAVALTAFGLRALGETPLGTRRK